MIVLQASATVLGQRGVETIAFADGTVWNHDDIIAHAHVNVAPVVSAALPDFVMLEDTAFSFALPTGSFSDADGDSLTYTATLASGAALPTWLLFDALTQSFSGTPPLDWNSADQGALDVMVTASDGSLSVSDTFTLTIAPVNDAPVAHDDGSVSTPYNVTRVFTSASLLANDTDVDSAVLALTGIGTATHGSVMMLADGSVGFTPDADYRGAASFTYDISDDADGTASATVALDIQGIVGRTITGTAANNTLTGTAFDDVIYGLSGNDRLNGNGGVDQLIGGAGRFQVRDVPLTTWERTSL